MSNKLTVNRMQMLCQLRLSELTEKEGSNHGEDWSANDWFTAFIGEAGELANHLKKIRRGDYTLTDKFADIEKEYADTLVYFIYLGNKLGLDISEVFVTKWNIIGERLDLPTNITYDGDLIRRVSK